ncbi:F0F1 ATP synthase subunit delta [Paracoccus aurantiacus]|uniref:ATP synthase subunit delta n=1 Tax=Paracoccus aurantiacus TaxID=2599412 RepID=A0A5C6SBB6_9RHOB|nr:F0F1 ATP synthase subunit delta [Paracoccus aurantiacus]TXB71093.1 F0F1 ATP synthase subunit delta [Paracoccus aurantiacus]
MTVANSASISASIAGRYAQALFDIVRESGEIDQLSGQVEDLGAALRDSDALRDLISSPVYTRSEQQGAIQAVAQKMGLAAPLANTLALMAQNRRLFALPQLVTRLQALIADERGEVTADVTSAVELSDEQKKRLTATLAEKSGKTVKLNTRVDESLIGGMIVKLGSQMIDSSIKSKLASLQNAMKEVG